MNSVFTARHQWSFFINLIFTDNRIDLINTFSVQNLKPCMTNITSFKLHLEAFLIIPPALVTISIILYSVTRFHHINHRFWSGASYSKAPMGQISTSPTPPRLFLPNYGTLILCPGHLFTFYRNPDFYMTIILRLIPILIFFYSCHTFSIAATGDGK